jgi:triacylglycerol lipase
MNIPTLKAPIVLVHGLLGYDRITIGPWLAWDYFRGIGAALGAAGNRVLVPKLSPTAGVEQRAGQLRRFLDRHAPREPVHLIAHSLGGLDARFMIGPLGMDKRVLSLTTIGTPHRGSPFADWGMRRFEAFVRPFMQALYIPYLAFRDLTTAACRSLNERMPFVPGIRYFSVAGRCEGPWLTLPWRLPHAIVARAEGDNDGVVSIASATYGEHTEIWDGDHLNLINIPNHAARRRRLWTDRAPLYAGLVRRLADCGF